MEIKQAEKIIENDNPNGYGSYEDEAMRYIQIEYCPPSVRVDEKTGIELDIDDWSEYERIGYTDYWSRIAKDENESWNSMIQFMQDHKDEYTDEEKLRMFNQAYIHYKAHDIANRRACRVYSWHLQSMY